MEGYKKLSEYDIRSNIVLTDLFPSLRDNGDGTYTNINLPFSVIRTYSAVPGGGTTGQYLRKQNGTDYATQWYTIPKSDVGLGSVDNTADADKPVSTATAAAISAAKQALYPVGSIYINATNSTNPGTLLGFGTWVAFGAGRVPVGFDATQTEFDTAEETGGEKTHTLTVAEMPAHNHTIGDWLFNGAAASGVHYGYGYQTNTGALTDRTTYTSSGEVQGGVRDTGGGGAHNNLQPYITVYMWKRTA